MSVRGFVDVSQPPPLLPPPSPQTPVPPTFHHHHHHINHNIRPWWWWWWSTSIHRKWNSQMDHSYCFSCRRRRHRRCRRRIRDDDDTLCDVLPVDKVEHLVVHIPWCCCHHKKQWFYYHHHHHHHHRTKRRIMIRIMLMMIGVVMIIIIIIVFVTMIMNSSMTTTTIMTQQQQQQQEFLSYLKRPITTTNNNNNNHYDTNHHDITTQNHCAINLYGLPRQYSTMIHNSVLQNIIRPNLIYQCDYYIHYYNDTTLERIPRGADIGHGNIRFDPHEILQLQYDILKMHYNHDDNYDDHSYHNSGRHRNPNHTTTTTTPNTNPPPIIQYRTTSEMEFQQLYHSVLQTIYKYQHPTTKQYIYQPYYNDTVPLFSNTTLMNIIKMWHSQQSVFELMDSNGNDNGNGNNKNNNNNKNKKHYHRVGMFRNDVLYVTPIDIYEIPKSTSPLHPNEWNILPSQSQRILRRRRHNRSRRRQQTNVRPVDISYDTYNEYAVIPNFANVPLNDRMIYGPYDAIQIYATYKFRMLFHHIHTNAVQLSPSSVPYGIHSEQYLYRTIFPLIQQYGKVTILQHSNICFLRVRTDYSIRINDCCDNVRSSMTSFSHQYHHNIHTIIEDQLLLRSCQPQLDWTVPHVPFLLCPPSSTSSMTMSAMKSTDRRNNPHNDWNRAMATTSTTTTTHPPPQWEYCPLTP